MSDPQFWCAPMAGQSVGDSGGVHINSGIPNHAYALAVDGGSYNGRTVTGIGFPKAAKIWYRALTTYLTSGATFLDSYNALIQSCSDLTGTNGITAANCTQVTTALQAVEMNQTWGCAGAVAGAGSLSFGNTDDRVFSMAPKLQTPTGSRIRKSGPAARGGE